jgi:hypothetical protein
MDQDGQDGAHNDRQQQGELGERLATGTAAQPGC